MASAKENILLSPLQRIAKASESLDNKMSAVALGVDVLIKGNIGVKSILERQTDVLLDIKTAITDLHNDIKGGKSPGKAGGEKGGFGLGGAAKLGIMVALAAGAVTFASYIMQGIAPVSVAQLATAILISLTLIPLVKSMVEMLTLLSPVRGMGFMAGKFALSKFGGAAGKDALGPGGDEMSKNDAMKMTFMLVLGAAALITVSSYILSAVKPVELSKLISAAIIGVALQPMAMAFLGIVAVLRKGDVGMDKNGVQTIGMAMLVMVAITLAVAGVATAMALMPATFIAGPPLDWIFMTGLMLFVFSVPLAMIIRSVKGLDVKQMIFSTIAIPLIALAIAGVSYAMQGLSGTYIAPPVSWTLKAALALFTFSLPLRMILRNIKGLSLKEILLASLSLPLLAGSIAAVALIFTYLDKVGAYNAPPVTWTMESGLALLLFAVPFTIVAMAANKIGFKGLIMGALAIPLLAAGILGAAWLFSYLPGEFIAPPIGWAISSAIAITAFAIPFAIVGALAQAITPLGLVLGAAGIVLIAGSMWAVAWIFSKMPDLSAISKNITDALMYPVNEMITALSRFKNEIGIENLLPLAGGILAIAGSWLALTAALAGQAAGGLISSVANLGSAIIDGIGSLFGGGKTQSPIDLLDMLIDRQEGIKNLAKPVKALGENFATMSQYTEAVITGVTAFSPFLDEDNAENFTESANAATTLALAYEKLANASNIMNVAAITESTKMFDAIARVAEADGEDAMTVLAEKLMEAVNQLSETVENLQESNGENANSMQDAISSTIGGFIDKIKGTTDKSEGNESGLVDVAPIVAAIQELEDRLNRPLRVEEV